MLMTASCATMTAQLGDVIFVFVLIFSPYVAASVPSNHTELRTAQEGNIISPDYYERISDRITWRWIIEVEEGQQIKFYQINTVPCSRASVTIEGVYKNRKFEICGDYHRPFLSIGPRAVLTYSNKRVSKGLFIAYEAYGCRSQEIPPDLVVINKNSIYVPDYQLKLRCPEGQHFSDDTKEITWLCTGSNDWEPVPYKCLRRECEEIGEPADGDVTYTDAFKVGSVARYECHEGFTLEGDSTRTCQKDGEWSGTVPTCKGKIITECSRPDDPEHGTLVGNTNIGSRITYTCDVGYEVVGQDNRTCGQDGKWTGKQPRCVRVTCPSLPDTDNGNVTKTGTSYGDLAMYVCNKGYELSGDQHIRECLANGTWSGQEHLNCKRIQCPKPTAAKGGKVSIYNGTTIDTSGKEVVTQFANYSCFPGFDMKGVSELVCSEDGSWIGERPECHVNSSNHIFLTKPTGIIISPDYYGHTDVLLNWTWSMNAEEGQRVQFTVEKLTDCENALITLNDKGLSRPYSLCRQILLGRPGYSLSHEVNINYITKSLLTDGIEVSYEVIGCKADDLPSGLVLINKPSPTIYGHYFRLKLKCPEGRHLKSSLAFVTWKCLKNNTWETTNYKCEENTCPEEGQPANGDVRLSNGQAIGSIAQYSCDEGYNITGDITRTCLLEGRWSGVLPNCEGIMKECSRPDEPEHGSMDGEKSFNSKITARCNEGYERVSGDEERWCGFGGKWNGTALVCSVVRCPNVTDLQNGMVEVQTGTFGDVAVYRCNRGFTLHGKYTERTCLANKTWSGDDAESTCVKNVCKSPQAPSGGSARMDEEVVNGTTLQMARFSCETGFVLWGLSEIRCSFEGEWIGHVPLCLRNYTCLLPPAPLDGHVESSEQSDNEAYRDVAVFSCSEGYRLAGNKEIICTEGGKWSDKFPHCESMRCNEPDYPENGDMSIIYTPSKENREIDYRHQVAFYECHVGYQMVGPSHLRCSDDGEWIGGPTKCEEIHCPQLQNDGSVTYDTNNTRYDTLVTSNCTKKFEKVSGDERRICEQNGTWSGNDLVCKAVACGQPVSVPNAAAQFTLGHGNDAIVGSKFTYVCKSGFKHTGTMTTITCMPNKSWTTGVVCTEITCPQLHNSTSVTHTSAGTKVDTVVHSVCAEDMKIASGNSTRLCMTSGQWSGTELACITTSGDGNAAHQKENKAKGSTAGMAVGLTILAIVIVAAVVGAVVFYKRRQTPANKPKRFENPAFEEDTPRGININVGDQVAAFKTADQ